MPATDFPARPDFAVSSMANLLAQIHATFYVVTGMPDAAMDALWDAHDAVMEEIVKTPSAGQTDVRAKTAALAMLNKSNAEEGTWDRNINYLSQSIAADIARLRKPPFLIAGE